MDKVIFNIALIVAFWLQHSIMARSSFKEWMNKLTKNQYFYYERSSFVLLAGVMLNIVMFLYQPIDEVVVFSGFNSGVAMGLALVVFMIGNYFFMQSMWDFRECDVFGFDHFRYFKKEGNEFPVPFKMKYMSRVAYACRHAMLSGILMAFIGVCLYG